MLLSLVVCLLRCLIGLSAHKYWVRLRRDKMGVGTCSQYLPSFEGENIDSYVASGNCYVLVTLTSKVG